MRFSLAWLSEYLGEAAGPSAARAAETLNEIGIEIGEVASEGRDSVLDADVTPNRPDAMNHRGVARDLAAALRLPFRQLLPRHAAPPEGGEEAARRLSVTVEVPERCARFAARIVAGTRAAASPPEIVRRLAVSGQSPINVIVDATNFSIWDIGQPLHAFDAAKIRGDRLIVRFARRGEKLRCLDGVERELHPEDVVVADAERALSLAGVIGGSESAISEGTRDVVLESAWWDPVSIRRTARRHGLHTDASHRYERGADVEAIPAGLALASRLIVESAGGALLPGTIDVYPRPWKARGIRLRAARLEAVTGIRIPGDDVQDILSRLGFRLAPEPGGWSAEAPSWRPDVAGEDDLVEEIARIHGYGKIPSALPPLDSVSPRFLDVLGEAGGRPAREIEDRAADSLREAGLLEAYVFPFAGEEGEAPFGNLLAKSSFAPAPLRVVNPLDRGRGTLRRLLLPGLLEAAARNLHAGNPAAPLFEVGRVWDRRGGADTPDFESRHAAFVLAGRPPRHWSAGAARPYDFYDLRGVLEDLLSALSSLGRPAVWSSAAAFLEGAALSWEGERGVCAVGGRLSDALCRHFDLPAPVFAAEVDLRLAAGPLRTPRFSKYSLFPPVDVDLTLSHPRSLPWERLRREIEEARLADLESLDYVARFAPEGEAAAPIRSTVRLRFRSADRTLSQEEVFAERDRLVALLQRRIGVQP